MAQVDEPAADAPVVAFDFDGTLTIKDSFTAFLKWRAGPLRWWLGCLRLAPAALAVVLVKEGLHKRLRGVGRCRERFRGVGRCRERLRGVRR
jgi:hypothetical protein